MRISEQTAILACLFMAICNAAAAKPYHYAFLATVVTSSGGTAPGTVLPITVTVDPDFPKDPGTTNPFQQATYSGGTASPSGNSPLVSATIGGNNAREWFDGVHVQKNLKGISAITIQSALPQYGHAFKLVFSTTMKSVVKGVAIPVQIVPGNFQSSTFSVFVSEGDTFSGTLK